MSTIKNFKKDDLIVKEGEKAKNFFILVEGKVGIFRNNEKIAERIKILRNYGSRVKYYFDEVGYNSRLDELQAAMLRVKLRHLDEINRHKNELANLYFKNIEINKFILPSRSDNYFDVFHIFNVRHQRRDELAKYLLENGIKTEVHYPLSPSKQKAISSYFPGESYPISEEIHSTTLSLPISFGHSSSDIDKVVSALNTF